MYVFWLVPPMIAFAYTGQDLASGAKLSIEQARGAALNAVPGTITDEELESQTGRSAVLKRDVNAAILEPARWWRSHPWRRVCANWHIRYHGDVGIYRKATAKARRPSPAGTRHVVP